LLKDAECVACGAPRDEGALTAAPPAPADSWPLPPSFALPPLPPHAPPVGGRLLLFCLKILLGAAMIALNRGPGSAPLYAPAPEEVAGAAADVFYDLKDLEFEAREAGLFGPGDAERVAAAGGLGALLVYCGRDIIDTPPGTPRAVLGRLGKALLAHLAK